MELNPSRKLFIVRFMLILSGASLYFGITPAQQTLAPLTVEKIMKDPRWIGSSPDHVFWSPDSKRVYFDWNPDKAASDSLYYLTIANRSIHQAGQLIREIALAQAGGTYNRDRTLLVYSQDDAINLLDLQTGKIRKIIQLEDQPTSPVFSFGESCIVFHQGSNLFAWDLVNSSLKQLTDFNAGKAPAANPVPSLVQAFLTRDELNNSSVLRKRHNQALFRDSLEKARVDHKKPLRIYLNNQQADQLTISPDGRYIFYRLRQDPVGPTATAVPEYVTVSGYTQVIRGRSKAGTPYPKFRSYIYDRKSDTVYPLHTQTIPGMKDIPEYLKDYPTEDSAFHRNPPMRQVVVMGPFWNESGTHAFVVVRALDNKDRWIMLLDPRNGNLKLLDRQHDEAWVDGPGIGWDFSAGHVGWVNDTTCWYQSEVTGYSHLYLENIRTGQKKALTSGAYEVMQAKLSRDRKYFYLTTNQVHPGELQYYKLTIATGKSVPLTRMEGGNKCLLSPDNRYIAFRHSFSNHPWELYLQSNLPGALPTRITHLAESPLFRSYPWRAPRIITFTDRYGKKVYARLFRPATPQSTRPGVIFIHGAGYLQDAMMYWSDYYFREYLFENLLADQGYTVMDIDYSGSAGYGRDWRTAIYRHMGGRDLDDIVDGSTYMVDSLGVNRAKIGIWGGSYGGFLTLMALFTKPGVFACGAALRSVTDWAHYNHEYTSNILNDPDLDSLAYLRSSPIWFAAGLKDHLLLCHGMQDTNVHFQDIVRLTEKLIELGKKHWSLAVYPMENHDFSDASSWTDEYRRILQLFNHCLGPSSPH
ncbi:MAG TPA: prolyl oligopeptidase family serine peptidase [Chitinophagaceae bacterium]|nr:prolyl oligopeptidase family serine peptidase [Chitinophagaceae bacterium]